MSRRTYVGELEWAIAQISRAFSDRNPNRDAQVRCALDYAFEVSVARTSREHLPTRPDISRVI